MALTKAQQDFISTIAPIVQKYAKQYGYKVVSPIIAQACVESAYGKSMLGYKYHNYFGMKCGSSWKGKSVNMSTKEEYTVGTLTTIKDNFRVYATMDEGVKGYFNFISIPRYANLKTANSPRQYLEYIKADGYATSSTYVTTNLNTIKTLGLEKYDDFSASTSTPATNKPAQPKPATTKTDAAKTSKKTSSSPYLRIGDSIKLRPGTKYYDGKTIPSWVTKANLYYRGTNSYGAIISTKRTGAITGIVDPKDIIKR